MKPVLTPSEAGELDRATQARGVEAVDLMERAGRALARAAVDASQGIYGRRAVVICGKGNNGGDGFVAARHLAREGMRVDVITMEPLAGGYGPAAVHAGRLSEQGLGVRTYTPEWASAALARADVAVDAIFGTGFRGVPEGIWAQAIGRLNDSPAPVVSADIPSGVDGTSGAVEASAVWAELTVAFGAAKVGSVLLPGAERSGTVRVADVGFPDDLLRPSVVLTEPGDVEAMLPHRPLQGHKRSSGVLLVVAGSRAMTGAPALIARAAGRVGTGLVVVGVPQDAMAAVQAHSCEAVFEPLAQTDAGTVALGALDTLLRAAERADAIAVGPGLTRDEDTAALVRELVARSPVPIVLDADGLSAFEGNAAGLRRRRAAMVLTPHDGEFARIMAGGPSDAPDRIAAARELAVAAGAVTLLKGTRTVIAPPEGVARVNPTGGPALATAGTGDVLSGVIGGLLARGMEALDSATAGAFLHGLAGSIAGRERGEGTLAGDVADRLPDAVSVVLAS